MLKTWSAGVLISCLASVWWLVAAEPQTEPAMVDRAAKLFQDGNFAEAYDQYRELLLKPDATPTTSVVAVVKGVEALHQLGRRSEVDAYLQTAVTTHPKTWQVLHAAAEQLMGLDHSGELIAGAFVRDHQGTGEYVSAAARDRVQVLRWLVEAMPLVAEDPDREAVGEFYLHFAEAALGNFAGFEAWRLQQLTDLSTLPDYEPAERWRGWGWQSSATGAPVDAEGNPWLMRLPSTWAEAKNDGERWRWLLEAAGRVHPPVLQDARMRWAQFLQSQFGTETVANLWAGGGEDDSAEATGPFAMHTLADDETIARLATGVKRFKLADEFHPLAQYRLIAASEDTSVNAVAADSIARMYENRRQYVPAAAAWQAALDRFGDDGQRKKRLAQITGAWGQFEGSGVHPAGTSPQLGFRFRNAKRLELVAHAIKVPELLEDVKSALKARPKELNWQTLNIGDLGYRLVVDNQEKYRGGEVARWGVDLDPKPNHADRRIDVTTPLEKAGAYLVTATLADGNTSHIVLWIADTAIVKKPLDQRMWYFVADAVTGAPLAKANVEFFGWRQDYQDNRPNQVRIQTKQFAEFTSATGEVLLDEQRLPSDHQWLVIARTDEGRFAYQGFSGVWYGRHFPGEYFERKTYLITDRPVYRPEQTVKFKLWLQQAKYDQPDASPYAHQKFTVQIFNPQGETVFEEVRETDDYGGIEGTWPLAKGAMLGSYQLFIKDHGGGSFRVEEYKKPEFEVTVEAPTTPVQLGETIPATIRAKYYFGSPVTSAQVKYKVERRSHAARWYPSGPWDWFYGRGYRWQGLDYAWYPGWGKWGCFAPHPWWAPHSPEPPELITEQTVDIGPDGTVVVSIDTLPAKELHGDDDHAYTITAEVVDESRRTIVGTGEVLVARQPFQITTWIDHGFHEVGETVTAHAAAFTLDQRPVKGSGKLTLYRIAYDAAGTPQETAVESWELNPDTAGQIEQKFLAAAAGQYRLAFVLTDDQGRSQEGAYVFMVRGAGFDGRQFRFNDLELLTDKVEYAPGDKVKLLINTRRPDSTVALFLRPAHGHYQAPEVFTFEGQSALREIEVTAADMPNFFVEAGTISGARFHQTVREVVVPPAKRVLDVQVTPSQTEYLPGAPAELVVKLTDAAGKPFVGSTVLSVYDRSVDYIAGGSNVPEIREFFWKWRRSHNAHRETSLDVSNYNVLKPGDDGMQQIGMFGDVDLYLGEQSGQLEQLVVENRTVIRRKGAILRGEGAMMGGFGGGGGVPMPAAAPMMDAAGAVFFSKTESALALADGGSGTTMTPAIRKEFADTAYWNGNLTTDADGVATVRFNMPENLTGWKVRAWGMGRGAQVGEGTSEVTTKKNLLVRLQAPRFFVETDEVVLSANILNDLTSRKSVRAVLELEGGCLEPIGSTETSVEIDSHGEQRVDWRVKVVKEGTAVVRMKALTDEESDAMEHSFPVYVHGMLRTESYSTAMRPADAMSPLRFTIPAARKINESRIVAQYSPTLAGALVDALPYLADYPYGCTEQTLNRFLPTVVTQRILQRMEVDLAAIAAAHTNLNAQELNAAGDRWKRTKPNPVFSVDEVTRMTKDGVERLTSMQLSDGGWGWFSGFGERSYPHTTAVVVQGLQTAQQCEVALVPGMLERGIAWLKRYQDEQVTLLKNAPKPGEKRETPWKGQADALDALVYKLLVHADIADDAMRGFLYRDRIGLPVSAKVLFGLALHRQQRGEELAMLLRNIEQFVVQDEENQTAYLRLPEDNWWWAWYGHEIEANAYYLKLLAAVNPQDPRASRLVKYLLNNRRNGSYWSSTRDTALCIEALADYLVASGEARPDLTVEVWLDGSKRKEVAITAANLFTFDNRFVLEGDAITDGEHVLEFRKRGTGPLYANVYVTTFTQEELIPKAGLEVRVQRKLYKLTRVDAAAAVAGSRGQAVEQAVEKFTRTELANLDEVTSGDLLEVELEIDSKNDYEYLVFEDRKASGCEPVDLRSGYLGGGLGAYVEYRDERTAFFVRSLPRGKHSVSYRLRAEIPGRFSALPTVASAMYAPELRGNSDELKLRIRDR